MQPTKVFERLTAKASTGKEKEWMIRVEENPDNSATVTTVFGYVSGKKQTNTRVVTKGKNIGKINETTPFEQGVSDANSKWQKKYDTGYRTSSEQHHEVLLPMLALDYSKRGHDIQFPCLIQPKVDGVRCMFNKGTLFSRWGKVFPHLTHILDELKGVEHLLDGELYSYTLSFQEIVGLVRKIHLTPADKIQLREVKYIVFDNVTADPFKKRHQVLVGLFNDRRWEFIELLVTKPCPHRDHVYSALADFEQQGYEGVILRNQDGLYKQKYRSKDLQKLKSFHDAEYKIIDYAEGEGLEKGCVIWICETATEQPFRARPTGTREDRMQLFRTGNEYVGKLLTVKYQELTTDGIPRFPVGVTIRNYE
ncbi:ATP-dependent DNA ligase [bacterium]|nr:ATP-dependent DNA ligase [bacterium]